VPRSEAIMGCEGRNLDLRSQCRRILQPVPARRATSARPSCQPDAAAVATTPDRQCRAKRRYRPLRSTTVARALVVALSFVISAGQ